MDKWQPISTATKRKRIIGWTPPDANETRKQSPTGYINMLEWTDGIWQDADGGGFDWEPTMWMPLPEPPNGA